MKLTVRQVSDRAAYEESAAAHDESDDCLVCDAGKYQNQSVAAECVDCGVGMYLGDNATGATFHDNEGDCLVCESGKFQTETVAAECVDCGAGKFLADEGAAALEHDAVEKCRVCEAGTYTEDTYAAACTNCITGKFLPVRETCTVIKNVTAHHIWDFRNCTTGECKERSEERRAKRR